jgi:hypothetical protein
MKFEISKCKSVPLAWSWLVQVNYDLTLGVTRSRRKARKAAYKFMLERRHWDRMPVIARAMRTLHLAKRLEALLDK